MTLLSVGIAWLVGVALASWLEVPLPVCVILSAPAVVGLLFWSRDPVARHTAVCALALLAGGARVGIDRPDFGPTDLAYYNDYPAPATVIGVIAADPDVRGSYQNLQVQVETLTLTATDATSPTMSVDGWLQVQTRRYPERAYGERISLTGRLATPRDFDTFSYRDYLARQHVYSQMSFPRIDLLAADQGNPVQAATIRLRHRLADTAARTLPEPMAGLLTAILLGIRGGIPRAVYEQFNETGTSHIIVISGSNIVVICGLLLSVTTRTLGRRWAPWVALVGVAGYTLLVGGDAPVLRAAITGGLAVLALHFGRQAEARTSLVLAAVLMTVVNPSWLEDAGFQLSFSATAGLVWLVPRMQLLIDDWLNRPSGVSAALRGLAGDGFMITSSAQLATLPIIASHFTRLSPVSLVANLLIVPVQPLVMLAGAAAMATGTLWLPAGQVLGWIVWLPLAWTVLVVERLSGLSIASVEGNASVLWYLVALGLLMVVALFVYTTRKRQPFRVVSQSLPRLRASTQVLLVTGGIAVAVAWVAAASLPDGRLHVAFLDVGQGDAILITTPNGAQIVVDGGPDPSVLLAQLGRRMPFWDRSLDLVVNTHPDNDHLTGLVALLDRFHVDHIMTSDVAARSPLVVTWQERVGQAGVPATQALAGSRITTSDGVQLSVLHPGDVPAGENRNNHSVVLRLTFGGVSFLLTGDIDSDVEYHLVQRHSELPTTVLKVPHHGSATSSSDALLHATHPAIAIISVGTDNDLGLPDNSVVMRYDDLGIPVLRTDHVGTVEFVTDGSRLWLSTDREPSKPDHVTAIAPPPVLQ